MPIDLIHGNASTASAAIIGDSSSLVIGLRKNVTIEASRVAGSDKFNKMQALMAS